MVPSEADTAICIRHLAKTYQGNVVSAVNDLTLNVSRGSIFGLLGPNGAGKTTLIQILCGLRPFDSGELSICGLQMPQDIAAIKPLIGVVPQDIALYPTLTAAENLNIFGRIGGLSGKLLQERSAELLERFGLAPFSKRRVEHFSGGMKRRLNLIAGIMHRPQLLFLDEPTVGVDVQSKSLMLENIRKINAEGTTIVYTSHYMEEAETLCNEVAIIDEGRLLCHDTPTALIALQPDCRSLEAIYLKLTGKELRDN